MLRGIAEFVMSGRRQAATVAILFALVPLLNLLSGAVVALVTLRKGWREGFLVMLWAQLPALLSIYNSGDATPAFLLVAALLCGESLRRNQSWSIALMLISALGLATQLSLVLQDVYVAKATGVLQDVVAQGTIQTPDGQSLDADSVNDLVQLLLGFYGAVNMALFVVCLAIGRHWQALLYNPGGFRQEFHALRLDPRFGGLLLALLVAGEAGFQPFAAWLPLFVVPAMVNGIALCHHVVAQRKLGIGVLVLAWLLSLAMAPVVIALGFLDSLANLRRFLAPRAEQQK